MLHFVVVKFKLFTVLDVLLSHPGDEAFFIVLPSVLILHLTLTEKYNKRGVIHYRGGEVGKWDKSLLVNKKGVPNFISEYENR